MTSINFNTLLSTLFFFLATILLSCSNINQGLGGMSQSMEESKTEGVFIAEYYCSPNNYISVGDSINLEIKEIWLEHNWKYGENYKRVTHHSTANQLCVLLKDTLPRSYYYDWTIGLNSDLYCRPCGSTCLISDLSGNSIQDTIYYEIQLGSNLRKKKDSLKVVIGDLTFIKK